MIHRIWVPMAYKIAPILVGTLFLNTIINKTGPRPMGVPMPVLKSIATLAHETVTTAAKVESGLRRKKMPGAAALVVSYSGQLEYYADVVREILSGRLDHATATYRHPELSRIIFDALDRHMPG